MADWLTPEQRSRNMGSIRSTKNQSTEETFARLLRGARITGWRRHINLPGKPDFAFRSGKVLVFVDGCFWHGCPKCYRLPEDNRAYWGAKVARNRSRDRRTARLLREAGWKVLRIWEHDLKTDNRRMRALRRLMCALG
ncbi:MAG: very short patch repair endonuclease [Candidatus Sulfotelmatobacter sp.]|jgi:DNA mismatch endonuclease, patch repair protein